MPELPDLEYVASVLRREVVGRRVVQARTGDPTVLRVMVPEPLPLAVAGRVIERVERRGHFLRFQLGGELVLVVNAMLVGKYRLLPGPSGKRDPAALGFALSFDDRRELHYLDDKRMGKVYLAPVSAEGRIPVYGELGVDVLSPGFTAEAFAGLVARRRDQVRVFLMDKGALASIGNAYADEILFEARIHPKTWARQLGPEEIGRLHAAIGTVLRRAIEEIARRREPIEVKVRDFLAVRGRAGQPCRACGTTLREVRVGDGDACFCPHCQPAARSLFIDWSKAPPREGAGAGAASRGKAPRRPRSPR